MQQTNAHLAKPFLIFTFLSNFLSVSFCKWVSLFPSFKVILCNIYLDHQIFSFIYYLSLNILFLFCATNLKKYDELVHKYHVTVHNMSTELCDYGVENLKG